MKSIFNIIKKIFVTGFTIITFNFMIVPFNIVIPINLFTLMFTYIFGLLALPFFSILIMYFI